VPGRSGLDFYIGVDRGFCAELEELVWRVVSMIDFFKEFGQQFVSGGVIEIAIILLLCLFVVWQIKRESGKLKISLEEIRQNESSLRNSVLSLEQSRN